jgi:ATP synthase protein I
VSEPDTISKSSASESPSLHDGDSMQDYYQLKSELLLITLMTTGVVFLLAWNNYSFNIALNYLVGATVGIIYFKLLARDVERLGVQSQRIGFSRFVLFIGLIVFATQWQQLHIVPIFLGFITYKVAILLYTVQAALRESVRASIETKL